MRKSEYYGVNVPELGDRADITVVSQAIIDSENNQSGKVENMKATVGGTIISLTSETRQDALLKYYNGLAVQFISPVNASAGSSYKIKIGSLTEQPYNNKVDIKVGDIVQAIYGSTGFISANAPIPRSSSTDSNSEVTVATSNAVKQANDNANGRVPKTTQVIAGKGLDGGGQLNGNITLNVVSANDAILVNDNNIQLNPVNDLTTGGANKALSGEMGKTIDQSADMRRGYAPLFDGTPRDFIKQYKNGRYTVTTESNGKEVLGKLGLDKVYSYGTLKVEYYGRSACKIIYTPDRSTSLESSNINFSSTSNLNKQVSELLTWKEIIYDKSPLFLGNSGIPAINYIQTTGDKVAGNGYVDKTTGKLYFCVKNNTDVTVTNNFILATNIDNAQNIYNIGKYLLNSEGTIAYFDVGRFRIAYSVTRFYIPYPSRTLKIDLPFSYADTNYMVIGTHDYASPNGAICTIELDGKSEKARSYFSLTGNLNAAERITVKFMTIGLYK